MNGEPPAGRSRRVRMLLVALGVVIVAAVVGLILLLTNERQPPEAAPTLDPEIVTLPVPSPTTEPAELPEGTVFFEALPRTVLQFVVAEAAEAPDLRGEGALEAYRFEFDDGAGVGFTLHASQWRSVDDAARHMAAVVAEQTAEAGMEPSQAPPSSDNDTGDTATDAGPDTAIEADPDTGSDADTATGAESGTTEDPATEDPATEPRLEQGPVVVDDAEVGTFLLRVRDDGTATIWWSNATAVLRLDGPPVVLRDVYAGFPL